MTREHEYVFKPPLGDRNSPADCAIEFLGRKWRGMIVEVLLASGPLRYNELKEELDGISDKALSDALEDLEAVHIVDREVIDDRPVKVEYSLTEVGRSLEIIVEDFVEWKQEYVGYVEELEDGLGRDSDG